MIQLDDISIFAPDVANLSPAELDAVQWFTLLWTLFEAQALDNKASVNKIKDLIEQNENQPVDISEELNYFQGRYVENRTTNDHFEHLNFRKNDNSELVKSVLTGENNESKSQLISCLIIVYRFRNNFFHGLKWAYGVQGQLENFRHSANILIKCLNQFSRNN
ncbi:hypothetical protein ACRN98_19725 [Shewanella oncorhynchi]|uniref:hypothetical protein n=1 Tax=Shewanella TaxID=22 RepID=UPI0021DA94CE|nr:hypothetical protein [Shewanella sp. SM69]MCU8040669.1 hypothetical protein [Shewanella sp. SM69]